MRELQLQDDLKKCRSVMVSIALHVFPTYSRRLFDLSKDS